MNAADTIMRSFHSNSILIFNLLEFAMERLEFRFASARKHIHQNFKCFQWSSTALVILIFKKKNSKEITVQSHSVSLRSLLQFVGIWIKCNNKYINLEQCRRWIPIENQFYFYFNRKLFRKKCQTLSPSIQFRLRWKRYDST